MYLLGRSYAKQDQYELARETLNQLVLGYPNEKYSNKASSLLNDIQGKTAPVPEETEENKEEPTKG